ncbi:RHS repeat domain-containing protein [Luteibacter yeojuensis]|uniref:RHS repeat domain-containing protein n=1 Tax=Luteibacter yeojuensis TaxID=345309 RepID=UPI001E5165B3|nr:RHS repeat-associated core domain-containing protein [Luteibacter yeojuensis]
MAPGDGLDRSHHHYRCVRSYAHLDLSLCRLGRPESVTNSSKSIVWSATNFAFDRKIVTEGIKLNLGFPGQYFDDESGTWSNVFRDYKADLGRYIESDPSGLAGGRIPTFTRGKTQYLDSIHLA